MLKDIRFLDLRESSSSDYQFIKKRPNFHRELLIDWIQLRIINDKPEDIQNQQLWLNSSSTIQNLENVVY